MFSRTEVKVTHTRHFTVTAQWRSSHSGGGRPPPACGSGIPTTLGPVPRPAAPRPPVCVLPVDIHPCRPPGATTAEGHSVRCRLLSRSLSFAHPRRLL